MRSTWSDNRFEFHRRAGVSDPATQRDRNADAPQKSAQFAERVKALTVTPRLPLYLALLTTLLVSPSLFVGFQLDDYAQRYCAEGIPGSAHYCPTPLSIFTIAWNNPAAIHRMIEDGFLPFWTYDHLVIDFPRPLTALTHFIDYRLWPTSPLLMHAESIAWLAAAIFCAALLYRSVFGIGVISAAAAFAFAVDHVHGLPVGWLANRNSVMAGFFGTAALLVYHRGRTDGRPRAILGVTSLLLGLLSGEIALGAWGYLLAHALVLDRAPVRERVRALLPYVVATVAWRAVYSAFGFGAIGSELYLDPAREPLAFLHVLPTRLPLLTLGLFGLPPAEAAFFASPTLSRWTMIGSAVFLLALVVTFGRFVRLDRASRFWAVGAVLSLLPACSAFPHNRLLFFPSLGAMGLLAAIIDAFAKKDDRLPTGIAAGVSRVVVGLSGGLHAFISPFLLPLAACTVALTHTVADRAIPSALATMSDVPHQELILVTAPEPYVGTYTRVVERVEHKPEPERLRLLSLGPVDIAARRIDAHTLELTYAGGIAAPLALRLYGSSRNPITPGYTVTLEGLSIVVTRVTPDGRPRVARFTFAEPLDSTRLRWVVWHRDHFVPFTPPASDGAVVKVPAASSEFVIG